MDRQCRNRLAYGPATEDELERKKLLVIDLSMRNPLNRKIAGAMLARILSDSEMDLVPIEKAPILKQNLVRLRDERVRNRFFDAFAANGRYWYQNDHERVMDLYGSHGNRLPMGFGTILWR